MSAAQRCAPPRPAAMACVLVDARPDPTPRDEGGFFVVAELARLLLHLEGAAAPAPAERELILEREEAWRARARHCWRQNAS